MKLERRHFLRLAGALVLCAMIWSAVSPILGGSPLEGRAAPDFSLPLGLGLGAQQEDRVRLSDLRGKVVVLDFWASWCGPCKHSVPLLNRASARFEKQALVYGVNSESLSPAALAFVANSWGFRYPILRDEAREAQLAYGVEALPTVVIIDAVGIVRKVYRGEPTEAALTKQIANLIQ